MVSIWYQQVLFQSLDFIKLVLLIYHPNCWRTVVIFQVRSNMQHLAMKSLKKIRIIGWFSSQNIKYIIQCICQKAFSRCDEFQLFLHCAVPKKNATVWNQGSGISHNNCVDHVTMFGKNACHFNIRNYTFFVWTDVANNSLAQIISSLCTLGRFQYAPLRAFILNNVVRYLWSHVKVCVKSYRGIPTNRIHRWCLQIAYYI